MKGYFKSVAGIRLSLIVLGYSFDQGAGGEKVPERIE